MPVIKKKTKKLTKNKPQQNQKALVVKAKPKKNTQAYFNCMQACCQKKQKISQTAHECKTNALAVNKRMSAQKVQAVKKIKAGYQQLGKGLDEFIKSK